MVSTSSWAKALKGAEEEAFCSSVKPDAPNSEGARFDVDTITAPEEEEEEEERKKPIIERKKTANYRVFGEAR